MSLKEWMGNTEGLPTQMNPELLELIVSHGARWLCYSFLLWILIKVQKIQYNMLGLLAAAAVADLVTLIPMVGGYLSYPVLVICLWKATRAKLAPDIIFTVAVSSALMFCVNLWGIGTLMGQLGYDASEDMLVEAAEVSEEDTEEPALEEPATIEAPAEPAEPVVVSMAKTHPSGLTIKGIAFSARRPLAMLSVGGQVITKAVDEGFSFDSKEGTVVVHVLEIHRDHVLLQINNDQRVELHLE